MELFCRVEQTCMPPSMHKTWRNLTALHTPLPPLLHLAPLLHSSSQPLPLCCTPPSLQVTEVINELYNMRVVGWYHSHPSFPALPSVIDIANQLQVRAECDGKCLQCDCVSLSFVASGMSRVG